MRYELGLSGEELPARPFPGLFAGVGLLRSEYLCRRFGKYVTHPGYGALAEAYVDRICGMFAPDPVWYRTVDLEVPEANTLDGVDHVLDETNTMLGCRGVRRSRLFPEAFLAELRLVARLAARHPNLHLLVPFVNDVSDLAFARQCATEAGFRNKLGIMAEIPSVILALDDFLAEGVDNVTVGMNDLTSLTLGALRRSYTGVNYFCHPAMRHLLAHARERTGAWPGTLSIAGYIDQPLVDLAGGLGYDAAVVHYSAMADALGPDYANLPYSADLPAIKREAALRVRAQQDRHALERLTGAAPLR
jgi:phosphoenolpyruvate-protein kinase (PTS system EI component)